MCNTFLIVPPETLKQLTVGYFILSFLLAIPTVFGVVWGPAALVMLFSDPFLKIFAGLICVVLAPGFAIVWVVGFLTFCGTWFCISLALATIWVPLWIRFKMASVSMVGSCLGVLFVVGYGWGANYLYKTHMSTILGFLSKSQTEALKFGRTVVEFFAWMSFLFPRSNLKENNEADPVYPSSTVADEG